MVHRTFFHQAILAVPIALTCVLANAAPAPAPMETACIEQITG